eukprot:CAMPEP_0198646506 /NCGR_PEP_ID=MMETSP1467-20131203/1959_1 /TAXON_ID=1462469 /ORGANISM="unid. sp., Strain CCMP2135" /LENGTH=154 /DNA_ID=CAMNT_0044382053 /DNA_START=40 /DNA_END=504 /DNA_ORIENTATION=-
MRSLPSFFVVCAITWSPGSAFVKAPPPQGGSTALHVGFQVPGVNAPVLARTPPTQQKTTSKTTSKKPAATPPTQQKTTSKTFLGIVTTDYLDEKLENIENKFKDLDLKFILVALVPAGIMYGIEAQKTARVLAESQAFAQKAGLVLELVKTTFK